MSTWTKPCLWLLQDNSPFSAYQVFLLHPHYLGHCRGSAYWFPREASPSVTLSIFRRAAAGGVTKSRTQLSGSAAKLSGCVQSLSCGVMVLRCVLWDPSLQSKGFAALLHVGILFPWVRSEPASAAIPRAPGKSLRDTTIPFHRLGKTGGG